jgi:hypothetical protein
VEKILRVQPNVKKLYLLLRAVDAKSARERLHHEVLNTMPKMTIKYQDYWPKRKEKKRKIPSRIMIEFLMIFRV